MNHSNEEASFASSDDSVIVLDSSFYSEDDEVLINLNDDINTDMQVEVDDNTNANESATSSQVDDDSATSQVEDVIEISDEPCEFVGSSIVEMWMEHGHDIGNNQYVQSGVHRWYYFNLTNQHDADQEESDDSEEFRSLLIPMHVDVINISSDED